jgi:hypothetical protein
MSVDYCNYVVALKPHFYDWYGVFDKNLPLLCSWRSWERWTCQNTGHISVSHRVSVNVTQDKGITSVYLSSRDLSCSHVSFMLGKWTSGVWVCACAGVCGWGGGSHHRLWPSLYYNNRSKTCFLSFGWVATRSYKKCLLMSSYVRSPTFPRIATGVPLK